MTSTGADPALRVAVRFERARCGWDWREPLRTYVAAQQRLVTRGYAARLAATTNLIVWRASVVAQRQTVVCTVTDAVRVLDAPSSSTTVYVQMAIDTQITSTLGSFTGGEQIVAWRVQHAPGSWLVAGSFVGG